jgi:hypothetical protein
MNDEAMSHAGGSGCLGASALCCDDATLQLASDQTLVAHTALHKVFHSELA